MRYLFTALVFVLFGTLVHAQSLPDRYMVTDVASNDTLNIRAEPTASSDDYRRTWTLHPKRRSPAHAG
jgi:hypothetical protein